MLQYMIILLDDTSTSFCHYTVNAIERRIIGLDDLRSGIRLAMVENLTIQFVYPDYDLPTKYKEVIHTIDHVDIMPMRSCTQGADVITLDSWDWLGESFVFLSKVIVLRSTLQDLLIHGDDLKSLLSMAQRLNVIITDVEQFTDKLHTAYYEWLCELSKEVERLYTNGKLPQLNLLTDRLMLTAMNNCGAGDTCITLAPNGNFYICPAFYYENPDKSVGSLTTGINIKNIQLFKLDHAPICRNCDAWQCKRCIWLNHKTTLEVNTPSHEQCVMAHLERNASRDLLLRIRNYNTLLSGIPDIPEIDFLDPFDNINK